MKTLNSIFAPYLDVPSKTEATSVVAADSNPAAEPKQAVRARLNYNQIGVCPYCSSVMSKVECCGQTMFVCNSDRFVSPLPNEDLDNVGLPGMLV